MECANLSVIPLLCVAVTLSKVRNAVGRLQEGGSLFSTAQEAVVIGRDSVATIAVLAISPIRRNYSEE